MSARFLFAAALCALMWGQEAGAPVVIDGSEILRVYAPVGSFTAEERAPEIEHRITVLAEKSFSGEISLRPIPAENATGIVGGSLLIMAVTEIDAESAGVSREELAKQYAAAIQNAIANYRVRHTWSSLIIAVLKTIVVWALFLGTAWLLWRLIRWLNGRLKDWFSGRSTGADSSGVQRLLWDRSRLILMLLAKLVAGLTVFSEFSFVVSYTFGLFPQTAGISTTLMQYLSHTFGSVAVAIVEYLPSGGFVILALILTRYVLRALKFFSSAIEKGDLKIKGLHPEMAKPTYQLVRLVVILFALVAAFPYLPGGKSEALKGVSIFLGILLSLGSSSAVSNVLAGLVLTYMRPFHSGDRVKIADTVGDVLEKTLLVTRVRTIKNIEVVIPNSAILSNQILNYSALARTQGLILCTTVTIGYDAPWRTVHDLLISAALATDGILPEPRPFVLETSLNDFHVSYELNAYTDRPNEIQNIYSHLHEGIQDSFNRAGVEIMSPAFYALRDGNTVTIPARYRSADYEAPSFRLAHPENSSGSQRFRRAGGA